MKSFFVKLFRDNNDINEKNVIGFCSFFILILFTVAEIVSSSLGKQFKVSQETFDSFLWITLGSFGISSIDKLTSKSRFSEEEAPPVEQFPEENNGENLSN